VLTASTYILKPFMGHNRYAHTQQKPEDTKLQRL
jgi:hypothetical protein